MLFNDRRPATAMSHQEGGLEDAINSGRRVLISHHNELSNSPSGVLSGYVRRDESGDVKVFHNSRSTKGASVNVEDLAVIEDAKANRARSRTTYLDHPSNEDIKWRGHAHYFDD